MNMDMVNDNDSANQEIMQAASPGDLDALKRQLPSVENLDIQWEQGFTVLMFAAQNDHHETVELLAANHASLDITDDIGRTALYLASEAGHLNCLKILHHYGASVYIANKDGISPLSIAAKKVINFCVRELVNAGSYIEKKVLRALQL
ncbi:serine/threonine-protein phosphatase 6 regulatory ankyrin repeat subunit A [Biomphalaria pfeifferi]|uniref:Serine/threonine-protein phosphatase 6 regulatory ankyrin repeat subunit A n=1 Tax=Biomphalaria pfeifferi TaxID=112525 RepID=A0AAD8B1M4_BIOPF|nr:serine/threonine-protein phosphatase 6 regulatory ankyrin repeat subunit A [Biomphalaria pfeifferi]